MNQIMKLKIANESIDEVRRIGMKIENYNRPVLVSLLSIKTKLSILKKRNMLRGTNVFINDDLNSMAQEESKELLKIRREEKALGKNVTLRGNKLIIDGISQPPQRGKRQRSSKSSEDSPIKQTAKISKHHTVPVPSGSTNDLQTSPDSFLVTQTGRVHEAWK